MPWLQYSVPDDFVTDSMLLAVILSTHITLPFSANWQNRVTTYWTLTFSV